MITSRIPGWLLAALLSIPGPPGGQKQAADANTGSPTDGRLRSTSSGLEEAWMQILKPTSHAANLIVLKNKDVLCFWFTGSAEGESGVGIAVSRLSSGSRQWSRPVLIDSQEGVSYQNPVPFQAPDGTLWLLHTSQPAGQGQADAHVLILQSHDNGRSWSAPKVLFDRPGSFVRNPPLIMPDGGWLLPMYYTPSKGITTGAISNYSVVRITHDHGQTWTDCPIPQSNGYVQPSVILLPDHHYVAFFRSRFADWIYRSTSSDGCQWTAPRKTGLPNNNASIQATLLADHYLVLAFDDARSPESNREPKEGPRSPLAVALSTNNGNTWNAIRVVQAAPRSASQGIRGLEGSGPEEYSYPTIVQDPSGEIDLAFTWRRKTIKFVRFPESWLQKQPSKVK